jgi:copper chaperone CopZ
MQQRRTLVTMSCLGILALGVVGGCEKKTEDSAPALVASLTESGRPAPDYDLSSEPLTPQYEGTIVALSVEGMSCNVCTNKVGKALIAMEGVWFGRIALEEKTAWVEVDPEHVPDTEALIAAITDVGFTAFPFGEAPALPTEVPAGDVDEG